MIPTQFLLTLFFLTIIFLHIAKKNFGAAITYGLQSFIIVLLLFNSYLVTGSVYFLLIAILGLVVKVILAPIFFIQLIKKHQLRFLVSTYLNTPLTLIVVAGLAAFAHTSIFTALVTIVPAHQELLSLALGSIFISLFLVINRKGALSQIIGVLTLENSIVAFGLFSVVDQSLILQIGIIFSISIWIVIATAFISMIYKHFGSLNVTEMKHLKE